VRRQLVAFDLDNTLADSKSPITPKMSQLLRRLLGKTQVCVISGGAFAQFEQQLLTRLGGDAATLSALHLMPTCGTRYLRFDTAARAWQQVYADELTRDERAQIVSALNLAADALGYRPARTWGAQIEDRGSQVTFSALGQRAPLAAKEAWDRDGSKKRRIRDAVAKAIPTFDVRIGGSTSLDVTNLGIDKAYGIRKIIDILDIAKNEVIFVGDRLSKGGNDSPVRAMGVDCLEVSRWQETALVIQTMLWSWPSVSGGRA
jgi:HAD superfamily hydrolase (TIGR01484 family)